MTPIGSLRKMRRRNLPTPKTVPSLMDTPTEIFRAFGKNPAIRSFHFRRMCEIIPTLWLKR